MAHAAAAAAKALRMSWTRWQLQCWCRGSAADNTGEKQGAGHYVQVGCRSRGGRLAPWLLAAFQTLPCLPLTG